ncbi:galactose mutarotase-like enzyme [Rhizobium etli]|uniref:Galactose mutarotase-like enzyme n=1 Tax=Rhizobium etli TaxID=29449 RepID=A0A7W6ZM21_RHIET|nr:galactose mutarotase-like enzyme [Rhizobium etli]MBB4538498.1 galactose mutarotase-like enzyme [Rhizobium etli]
MPSSIRIGNQHLAVEVSSLGAEMQALTSSDGRSWLWTGDATYWAGRSPILFPIVGKAPDDKLAIGDTVYPMASMALPGGASLASPRRRRPCAGTNCQPRQPRRRSIRSISCWPWSMR